MVQLVELTGTEKTNYEKVLRKINIKPDLKERMYVDARGFSQDAELKENKDYCCTHIILVSPRQFEAELDGNGFSFMPELMEKTKQERGKAFSSIINAGNALYSHIKLDMREKDEDDEESEEGFYAVLEFKPVFPIDKAMQAIKKVQKLKTDQRLLAEDKEGLKKLLEDIAELNEEYDDLNNLNVENPMSLEMKLEDFLYKTEEFDSYFLKGTKKDKISRIKLTFYKKEEEERNLDYVLSELLDHNLAYSSEEMIKTEIKRYQDEALKTKGYNPEKMSSMEYYTALGNPEVVEAMPSEWFELKNPRRAPAEIRLNILDSDNAYVKEILTRLREKEDIVKIEYL